MPDIVPRWWVNKGRSHAWKPPASRLACSAMAATRRDMSDWPRAKPCFLYTDGVSEAWSRTNEEYGETRLVEFLTQKSDLAPEALICACLDDLNAFRSGQPLLDDLTIMAIQRTH